MGKSINGRELGPGISQRKDGLYQARFTDRFGKRKTLYAKTYSEIKKKFRDAQYEDSRQLNVVSSNMTLDEWFNVWLHEYKRNCRETTKESYTRCYNCMRNELGWRKLSTLNAVIIQKAINNLKSDATRRYCKTILVNMLNFAVDSDLIAKNIAVNINTQVDNDVQKEKHVLSDQEVTLFDEESQNSFTHPIFIIALNTGMRIGEILGLTWDCVDFEKGIIHVVKTLCRIQKENGAVYHFHPPKTKAGTRDIPMSKTVRDTLIEQKERYKRISAKYEPMEGFENLVFINTKNMPVCDAEVRRVFMNIVDRINYKHPDIHMEYFSPHSLRHTFATNCIDKGMRPKTLQKILGHSKISVTMDLYCHVTDETTKDEMSKIMEMV